MLRSESILMIKENVVFVYEVDHSIINCFFKKF